MDDFPFSAVELWTAGGLLIHLLGAVSSWIVLNWPKLLKPPLHVQWFSHVLQEHAHVNVCLQSPQKLVLSQQCDSVFIFMAGAKIHFLYNATITFMDMIFILKLSLGEEQGTPWMGRQSITGHRWNNSTASCYGCYYYLRLHFHVDVFWRYSSG